MTTNVTVKTHGWPVAVISKERNGFVSSTRVERWDEYTACIYDTKTLEYIELTHEGWIDEDVVKGHKEQPS